MPKKKSPPQLKVVFDTSVLYTQVAYDLLRPEIKKLISANSQHGDLSVQWCIPDIVIKERKYQMEQKANELLPSIQKLERLLGHNLNITSEILKDRVEKAIQNQIDEIGVHVIPLNTQDVDWKRLIDDAVARRPPFQAGEKEKGFRDAILANTFLQLVADSPTTTSVCRLVLVTDDGLLYEFVEESTRKYANVRILADLNELEGLINTLVSTVTEEFVKDIKEKVQLYFFEKKNENTFYYKDKIRQKIREEYGMELERTPSKDLIRENGTWYIGAPAFMRKERQRLYWMTLIKVKAKLYKYVYAEPSIEQAPESAVGGLDAVQYMIDKVSGFVVSTDVTRRSEAGAGDTKFQVYWSVNLSQNKRLTLPRIEKIEHAGTDWKTF